jgi:hypothetical protein
MPSEKKPFWRKSGKSQGLGDRVPIQRVPFTDYWLPPAAAVAALVRQLRGPHLSTCP